jgi:hypothetical protein
MKDFKVYKIAIYKDTLAFNNSFPSCDSIFKTLSLSLNTQPTYKSQIAKQCFIHTFLQDVWEAAAETINFSLSLTSFSQKPAYHGS